MVVVDVRWGGGGDGDGGDNAMRCAQKSNYALEVFVYSPTAAVSGITAPIPVPGGPNPPGRRFLQT